MTRMLRLALFARTLGAALIAASATALADEHGTRVPLLPTYVQECGSCHAPFAPDLLPAASWKRLMGGLQRHFDSDASLDTPMAQALGAWLGAHAATGKRARSEPPQDRITRAPWFEREHRKLGAEIAQRASVKSMNNCAACHPDAAQGRYRERDVRIPK